MNTSINPYSKEGESFQALLKIMDELRAQCPWDQKQTLESLRPLTLEEVYELSDSILQGDTQNLCKELGDVLLHIIFYAKISSESNAFGIEEVIQELCKKLIYRHPHIYGDVKVKDEEEVKKNWEQLKIKEGNSSVLGGVPKSLPSLIKAQRIQEKAAGVGFDWKDEKLVWDKVLEEMNEFQEELIQYDASGQEDRVLAQKMEEEFGDILFSLVNYARFKKINPENALEKTNQKFLKRFSYIESEAKILGEKLVPENLDWMEKTWNEAKTKV